MLPHSNTTLKVWWWKMLWTLNSPTIQSIIFVINEDASMYPYRFFTRRQFLVSTMILLKWVHLFNQLSKRLKFNFFQLSFQFSEQLNMFLWETFSQVGPVLLILLFYIIWITKYKYPTLKKLLDYCYSVYL